MTATMSQAEFLKFMMAEHEASERQRTPVRAVLEFTRATVSGRRLPESGVGEEEREHIRQLAAEHHVRVFYSRRRGLRDGFAKPHLGKVYLPHITDVPTYFVALHEIGHCACGHRDDDAEYDDTMAREAEAEAWAWALTHSVIKPTKAALDHIQECLEYYLNEWSTPMSLTGQERCAVALDEVVRRFAR